MIRTITQKLIQPFKKKERLKKTLNVIQDGHIIYIEGHLSNPNYNIEQLHIKIRGEADTIKIDNENDRHSFKFSINLNEYDARLNFDEAICDFFLYITVPETEFTEAQRHQLKEKASIIQENDKTFYKYTIRLGRFKETYFNVQKDSETRYLYTTVKGNISLSINKQIEQKVVTQIDYLNLKSGRLQIDGRLFTRSHRLKQLNLVFINRGSGEEKILPTNFTYLDELTKLRFGLNRYEYNVIADTMSIIEHILTTEEIVDIYFDLTFHEEDEVRRVRLGRPRFFARRSLGSTTNKRKNDAYIVSPYYTFRGANLSLLVDRFDEETYDYMEKAMRYSTIINSVNRHKDIWLIGERIDKAQDTGYHLFKYIRKNYPELNVYYVIKEDSPELANIKHLGNIVYFKSKEHIKLTLAATRIVGSHHPDYLYPVRSNSFKKKVRGAKVFIQHGIMGTKNMIANYGKHTSGFETDLFLVSSEREKELVVNDLEYNQKDVIVTGLSRFDALFEQDVEKKRQLLIMPTWREWLYREDLFLDSEYFERYKTLVHSEELHELADKHNFEIVICLHTNMQRYSEHFAGAPVRIINQGDANVQTLMKESMMMITDYSSVGFDFSFLNRPVVYYQFDRDHFFGKQGSHLDIENDLPGDIVYTNDELIQLVATYAEQDFKMKEENEQKSATFLTYKDQQSAERVFQAIKNDVRKKPIIEQITDSDVVQSFFRRFRRSRFYHPVMRLFYNVVRTLLPIDKNLIIFESGVGKQFADSPKYIYEEIVRRNLDYKKVWVCNNITRFNDPNTIRIKRYSPSYYYYLARANVWVNNQNYPARLQKRQGTTYIQTWHGTPLKKMLFDIDKVMGRTLGYVKRISKAVSMWDYLLSPSKFATNAFKSAFKYDGKIIESGYPRNDLFYRKDKTVIKEQVKKRLLIPQDKKVILYAPTFRDNEAVRSNRFVFDLQMDLHQMKEALGDEYVILLRMHVAITNKIHIAEGLEDFVINVSNYPEIQELLLISDVLITDYSSVMFDFANTKKPMLFFTYDLEVYRDQVRGFYFDFEADAPGPLVRTTEEIINKIENIEEMKQTYKEKYDAFYETYCQLEDGEAAKRVVDLLFA